MKKVIVANWKQNKNINDIKVWFEAFSKLYKPASFIDVIICPSYCYVSSVSELIRGYGFQNVYCGSQNVSVNLSGAHTGDVSVLQLKDFCTHSIVGHSEVGDPIEVSLQKATLCNENNIIPILCVSNLQDFEKNYPSNTILALEDPKNISGGGAYKSLDVNDIVNSIKDVRNLLSPDKILLYGGSVNKENINSLLAAKDSMNGFLVGNSSLDPQIFNDLINALNN